MIGQCGDGDAAIDLLSFESQFPATDALREHALTLTYAARAIQETAADISVTWSALQNPGTYSAPGQDVVHSAMVPVRNAADGLHEAAEEAAGALNAFADEAAEIKTRYRGGAKIQAEEFLQEIATDPEWNSKRRLTGKQDSILDALSGLTLELEASQRKCANSLGRIWGGKTYGALDENGVTASGHTAYGFTGEAYEALGEANLLPWGNNAEWNYTGLNQGGIVQGMLMGFGDGVEDTVELAGSMAFLRGIENGKAAWRGLFELGVLGAYAVQPNWKGDAAREKFKEMGKDAIGLDMWESDPARAGGRNIFDIVTIVLPAGVVAKVIKIGHLNSGKNGEKGAESDRVADKPGLLGKPRTGTGPKVVPEFAGVPPEFFGNTKPPIWETSMPSSGPGAPAAGSSAGQPPAGPPPYGVRIQTDPVISGPHVRDSQPQSGDRGPGGGEWRLVKEGAHGGPYQEFITGVKRPDGYWLEYVMPTEMMDPKTGHVSVGEVKFDSHHVDPGPPPVDVFPEAKGYYAWMNNIEGRMDKAVRDWFNSPSGQFYRQASAIKDMPNARLEWTFDDKAVAELFLRNARRNSMASSLLERGQLVVKWAPNAGKGVS